MDWLAMCFAQSTGTTRLKGENMAVAHGVCGATAVSFNPCRHALIFSRQLDHIPAAIACQRHCQHPKNRNVRRVLVGVIAPL